MERPAVMIALSEALDELERKDARKAQLIEMRYFGGLTLEESAEVAGITVESVRYELRLAQAWLQRELNLELRALAMVNVWERAQPLFLAALEMRQEQRAGFLDRECAGDPVLRAEVESLLAHDTGETQLGDLFQSAAAGLVAEGSLIGHRVGAYEIKSELGHGGMGTVYLAVRADDEFRKAVAIKVVRRGMDTHAMLERFRYERQILANLDHPYIARLLDGGSTEDHQPFFVMEYVEGLPVDRFCRESKLGVEAICRLFLRICEAVSYAHRNLVVHRDLKPSNIIVTVDGAPKLLDFGVAKLVSIEPDPDATVTSMYQRPITPAVRKSRTGVGSGCEHRDRRLFARRRVVRTVDRREDSQGDIEHRL